MKNEKPSDFEMQVLGVLWRLGASSVRDVLSVLPDGKERAYTSVLSVMQVMEKKGLLLRKREGLTDYWRPAMAQSRVLGPFLRRLVTNVFGGEPIQVMQHLLQETEISDADLVEIRRLLDAHEQDRRSDAVPSHDPKDKSR